VFFRKKVPEDRLRLLSERITALEEGQRDLASRVEACDADMSNLWDKVQSALGRLSARSRTREPSPTNGPTASTAEQINQAILDGTYTGK
jgi:hypothetical protein